MCSCRALLPASLCLPTVSSCTLTGSRPACSTSCLPDSKSSKSRELPARLTKCCSDMQTALLTHQGCHRKHPLMEQLLVVPLAGAVVTVVVVSAAVTLKVVVARLVVVVVVAGILMASGSGGGGSGGGRSNGGLMLCGFGGKLSEGINFSDGFGR